MTTSRAKLYVHLHLDESEIIPLTLENLFFIFKSKWEQSLTSSIQGLYNLHPKCVFTDAK